MKNRIIAVILSATLLCGTAFISAAAAPKAPKVKKITVGATGKTATVTWSKVKSAKGYQIKYGYTKKLKKATTKNIAKSKSKITLKKLKVGKTLYVKIRAKYKAGKKTKYTKFSAVKSAKLTDLASIPATLPIFDEVPITAAPTTAAPTTTTPTTQAPTTEPSTTAAPTFTDYNLKALAECTRLIGRGDYVGNNFVCDFTNAGFEVGLDCQGDVKLKLRCGGDCVLGAVIDGVDSQMLIVKEKASNGQIEVTFDTNLDAGYHTIRIVNLTENTCVFTKFSIDGTPAEKPYEKQYKIEVLGDSITCGNCIYNNPADGFVADGSKSYAALLAQKLNADLSVVARSGWGLVNDYGGAIKNIPSIYNNALPVGSSSVLWDHSKFVPDLVIINLGTNDTFGLNSGNATTTADRTKTAALDLIKMIRDNHPDCKIVWVEGMMGAYHPEFSAGVKAAISETENAYHTVLSHGWSGKDGHPNAEEHITAASELFTFLLEEEIIENRGQ